MAFTYPPQATPEQRSNNWGGNHRFTPAAVVRAHDTDDVLRAVRWAAEHRLPLRTMGAGHSFSPLIPTGGVLLDLQELVGITAEDPATERVRVRAGTPLAALNEQLWERGLALPVLGDHDKQTIAGAIATATHGSCARYGSLSSLVTWVRLVDGNGEIVEIGDGDLHRLRAARVALGTLGVVLEVELRATSAFALQEETAVVTAADLARAWRTDPAGSHHFSFHYFPADESPALLQLPVDEGAAVAGHALTRHHRVVDVARDSEVVPEAGHRRDRSYRVFTGRSTKPFHEMEQFVPVEQSHAAFAALTGLIAQDFPEQQYPLEVRWVAGDDAYLSPTHDGPRVALSLVVKPGSGYWDFLLAADELLAGFDARPHWGKLHFLTRERIEQQYPAFDSFRQVRRDLDPRGTFLNDHTRALLD